MVYPVNRKITGEEILVKAEDAFQNGQIPRRPKDFSGNNPSVDDAIFLLMDAGLITITDI